MTDSEYKYGCEWTLDLASVAHENLCQANYPSRSPCTLRYNLDQSAGCRTVAAATPGWLCLSTSTIVPFWLSVKGSENTILPWRYILEVLAIQKSAMPLRI